VPLIDCSHVARGSLGARPSGKPLHVRAFPAQKGDTIFRGGDPAYSPHLDRESGAGAEGAFIDRHHGTLFAVDDVEIRAAMLSALCWGCGLRG
jgi:hypothetical protein